MIADLLLPAIRHAYRTDRGTSLERNYLCTFLNDLGERVDVFENLSGATFFLIHHREVPAKGRREGVAQAA